MPNEVIAGRYEISAELGRGASASVFRAYDRVLERPVALKIISNALAADPDLVARFEREARLAARLSHPNIVTVYDVGTTEDGRGFIAMSLIEGRGLDDLIHARGPMPAPAALAILGQIAAALDYTHATGLIHRDVKPSNVRVDDQGRTTLTDFGIARALDSAHLTLPGLTIGTPRYMSPEQVRGEETTSATDIYSLAVIAYEMLTARAPFEGDGTALMYKIVNEMPTSPLVYNRGIPAAAVAVIERGLSKAPADRWPTAGAFASALERAVEGRETTVVSAPALDPGATLLAPTLPRTPDAPDRAATGTPPPPPSGTAVREGGGGFGRRARLIALAGGGGAVVLAGALAAIFALGGGDSNEAAAGPTATAEPSATATGSSAPTPTRTATPVAATATTATAIATAGPTVKAAAATSTPTIAPAATPSPTRTPTPSPTVAPTATPTPLPVAIPTRTPTPVVRKAEILNIGIDGSNYEIKYQTNYETPVGGDHVHFFWDTVPPEQAGTPGSGPWILYYGPSPFTGYSIYDRPANATRMCILVANPDHSVEQNSGNCSPLP